jgi:hypothetical protein
MATSTRRKRRSESERPVRQHVSQSTGAHGGRRAPLARDMQAAAWRVRASLPRLPARLEFAAGGPAQMPARSTARCGHAVSGAAHAAREHAACARLHPRRLRLFSRKAARARAQLLHEPRARVAQLTAARRSSRVAPCDPARDAKLQGLCAGVWGTAVSSRAPQAGDTRAATRGGVGRRHARLAARRRVGAALTPPAARARSRPPTAPAGRPPAAAPPARRRCSRRWSCAKPPRAARRVCGGAAARRSAWCCAAAPRAVADGGGVAARGRGPQPRQEVGTVATSLKRALSGTLSCAHKRA